VGLDPFRNSSNRFAEHRAGLNPHTDSALAEAGLCFSPSHGTLRPVCALTLALCLLATPALTDVASLALVIDGVDCPVIAISIQVIFARKIARWLYTQRKPETRPVYRRLS